MNFKTERSDNWNYESLQDFGAGVDRTQEGVVGGHLQYIEFTPAHAYVCIKVLTFFHIFLQAFSSNFYIFSHFFYIFLQVFYTFFYNFSHFFTFFHIFLQAFSSFFYNFSHFFTFQERVDHVRSEDKRPAAAAIDSDRYGAGGAATRPPPPNPLQLESGGEVRPDNAPWPHGSGRQGVRGV